MSFSGQMKEELARADCRRPGIVMLAELVGDYSNMSVVQKSMKRERMICSMRFTRKMSLLRENALHYWKKHLI